MAKRVGNRSFLVSALIDNWKNKGVALFLAIVVWAFAFGSTQEEWPVTATIDLKPPSNAAIKSAVVVRGDKMRPGDRFIYEATLEAPRTQVTVKLSGQRRDVRTLTRLRGELEIREDETEYELNLAEIFPDLPQGVLIKSTDPAVLRIVTEPRVEVDKKIVLRPSDIRGVKKAFQAPLADGITIVPPTLKVRGPRSEVASARLFIEPIEVPSSHGQKYEKKHRIVIEGASKEVTLVDATKNQVDVTIVFQSKAKPEELLIPVRISHEASSDAFVVTTSHDKYRAKFMGTEEGLQKLREKVDNQGFYFICPVDLQADSLASVDISQFTWPHGSLPEGVQDNPESVDTVFVVEIEKLPQ